MKICILYIGLGRYDCFWKDFYESCERNLLNGMDKHYYVFTDSKEIKEDDKTTVIQQDDFGWPFDAIFRFKMFMRIKDQLAGYDYIFFFNANAYIKRKVTADDILPVDEDYAALCMASRGNGSMGHESRPESAAYVSPEEAQYYFSGALNGGKGDAYIHLIETCEKIADQDVANGIMPVWHDESVLNKFLFGKAVKVLERNMGKPENWTKPYRAKIILRTKEKKLGRNWLRNYKGREHTNTILRRILRKLGLVK